MPDTNSAPSRAVFLSYAREDTEAARRIADALRAFGVEVWFDQSELRGGDTWDQKIRRQIRECALFVPIISAATQSRGEGYFRREWKLGVERTHDMAGGVAFIVPIVIDATPESAALVPEEFMRYQWTRLAHGVPSPEFVTQVKRLLETPLAKKPVPLAPAAAGAVSRPGKRRLWPWAAAGTLAVGAAAAFFLPRGSAPPQPVPQAAPAAPTPVSAEVNDKSIAVLPFANFSTEKENEFFADGLQDEVITELAKIHDLKVVSRTSVMAYKDPAGRNLKKIAAELGVATVLEASIQRFGTRVHLNAQLIDARTDAHLWAETYTEDLTDIFALEATLAQEVVGALKSNLTADERALINRKPTENAQAYDLYLKARLADETLLSYELTRETGDRLIGAYALAASKDPSFSLPHVYASIFHGTMYWFGTVDPTPERKAKALAELNEARRLAPDAPETHLAAGFYKYTCLNDWPGALEEYAIARNGMPNDADLHFRIGLALRRTGSWTEALDEFERSLALDPNNRNTMQTVFESLIVLRRYAAAVERAKPFLAVYPNNFTFLAYGAIAQYELDGDRPSFEKRYAAAAAVEPNVAFKIATAFDLGDLDAVKKLLASPDLTTVDSGAGTFEEPADVARAFVAWFEGRNGDARRLADAAIAALHSGTWAPRQAAWVQMAIAQAEAYSGRTEAAIRDASQALADEAGHDAFSATDLRLEFARLLAVCGKNDEALGVLREVCSQPSESSTRLMRGDLEFRKLKDDPRFEEILSGAKTF